MITNSSTEVFCYRIGSPQLERFQEEAPEIEWTELKGEQDLKDIVLRPEYYEWPWLDRVNQADQPEILDLLGSTEMQNYAAQVGPDRTWEFVKDAYQPAIGYAFATIYTDCEPDNYEKARKILAEIREESNREHLKALGGPGTKLIGSLQTPTGMLVQVRLLVTDGLELEFDGDSSDLVPGNLPLNIDWVDRSTLTVRREQ